MQRVLDRMFPSRYARTDWTPAAWLAIAGLLILAFTTLISRDLSNLGLNLLLIGSALSFTAIRRGDPDSIWFLLFLSFAGWMLAVNAIAGSADLNHWKFTREHLKIFLFLLCGWWLGGVERNAWILMVVALAGLSTVLMTSGAGDWALLGQEARLKFGFRNEQHSAVVFGSVLLGAVCLAPRAFTGPHRQGWLHGLGVAAWVGVVVISLLVVIASQTRQVLLGLTAGGLVALWLGLRTAMGRRIKRSTGVVAVVAILATALTLPRLMPETFDAIWSRSAYELAGAKALVAERGEEIVENSLTIRLMLWRLGLAAVAERPWIGHGAGYHRELIAGSDLPESIRTTMGHFHNSYLELWIAYGITGPIVFSVVLIALARRVLRAWRSTWLPADLAVFGASWIAFFAVVNLFESYVSYRSGHLLLLVIGGIVYGLAIPGRQREIRDPRQGSKRRDEKMPLCRRLMGLNVTSPRRKLAP